MGHMDNGAIVYRGMGYRGIGHMAYGAQGVWGHMDNGTHGQ